MKVSILAKTRQDPIEKLKELQKSKFEDCKVVQRSAQPIIQATDCLSSIMEQYNRYYVIPK